MAQSNLTATTKHRWTPPPDLVLALGVLAVSTASTLIRLAQATVPSLSLAAWRLTIATIVLAPFALRGCRDEWRRLNSRHWRLLFLSGLMLAMHFYTWITSLALTSVAASVVLVAMNPLFVGLISHFVLREQLTKPLAYGMLVAITGAVVIGIGDLGLGTHRSTGDLMALVGAIAVAIYMLIGRRLRDELSLLGYIFPVYGSAAAVLMALSIITRVPLSGYPAQAWLWLALIALVPQVIGHSAFNWALGHLPATYVALTVLAEPVGSTLLAWLVLTESPAWTTALGGLITLVGIWVASQGLYADRLKPSTSQGQATPLSPP